MLSSPKDELSFGSVGRGLSVCAFRDVWNEGLVAAEWPSQHVHVHPVAAQGDACGCRGGGPGSIEDDRYSLAYREESMRRSVMPGSRPVNVDLPSSSMSVSTIRSPVHEASGPPSERQSRPDPGHQPGPRLATLT